jgi:hypothetical protein
LKKAGIVPTIDASFLGAHICRRDDMTSFLASQGKPQAFQFNDEKYVSVDAIAGAKSVKSDENSGFGESDGVLL